MDDAVLLGRLLQGDEDAFTTLVRRYHALLVSTARCYVGNRSQAEDVAQDTWVAVVRGVDRFEGRSSFKTWLLSICANRARTSGARERRSVPVDLTSNEPDVDPRRFNSAGMWVDPPAPFTERVENAFEDADLVAGVQAAIDALPDPHRLVVTLRDVEGLSTTEVAGLLGLKPGNVRVILHRGRSKVRAEVEAKRQVDGR
jgi:RNA polymerase sigma-70 factor (ECF subfamily)